ncbi:MAG: hypothetical protein COA58_00500 [Bacteroidetes bacterium]|nr:MAG: hypothetical protein COA58_00500 [Bacteroidota bacterium]
MQRLLAFIEQNLYLLLFIVLQIICGFLLFGLNPYQQATFTHAASNLTAASNQLSSEVTGYIGLKDQNKLLQNQISTQFQNSPQNSFLYLKDTFTIRDTSRRPLFDAIPAQVVYNTVHKANNVFIINKGSDEGIQRNMGVISSEGVAGIVLRSNSQYSTVMSLLNTDMKVIPNINGSEYFTELVWDNAETSHLKIKGINKLEEIEEGDKVYTGKSSLLFPAGIPVGTISKLTALESSQYFETEMVTATNFRKLTYVYVIINRDAELIETLLPDDK